MSNIFHSSHLIRVYHFLRNICAGSRKVTLEIATPAEVNTPIGPKKGRLCLFENREMDFFLKVFRIQLYSKILHIGHVAMFYIEI